jgi:hypothetical protein
MKTNLRNEESGRLRPTNGLQLLQHIFSLYNTNDDTKRNDCYFRRRNFVINFSFEVNSVFVNS